VRITFLISGILFWANTFAQNNFYATYDFFNRNDFGSVITENQGNLLIFGSTTRGGYASKFLSIDSLGQIQFHKHYTVTTDDQDGGGVFNDSTYYGFGAHYEPSEGAADSHIHFINSSGDSLKTQIYNLAYNDRIHDLHLKADSTFIAYGFYTDTIPAERKPYIANIDTAGNILWFKTHSKLNHDAEIKNMQPTPDGGYVFSGTEEETPGSHTDIFLTKVDSVGDLVWKQYYHEAFSQRGGHVEVLADGNFAVFGTGYTPHNADRAILKINGINGNLIWRQKHGTNLDEGYIVGKELPSGNFICAGTSIRTYNNMLIDDVNLSMLDSTGNLLWSRDYNYHGLGTNEYVKDLIVTSDGGFAMTGFILNAPGGRGNDVFVLKTDANGLITSLNSGFREVTPDMRVYPNPTQGIVNIPYVEGLEQIEVYDLSGSRYDFLSSRVSQPKVGKNQEVDKKSLDLTNLSDGIYILKLTMKNGEVFSKKIIKK
jgi:hypothetical protein